MKRMMAWLASAAVMITALSMMIVPTSQTPASDASMVSAAGSDVNLLTKGSCGPNTDKVTVTTAADGAVTAVVSAGVDAHNNGHGLAIEPQLTGLNVKKDGGTGFIHLVMESDTPFRVTMLDRTAGKDDKWISFGGEFFNVFVPEGFTFANPDAPTIYEALYDGKEFMHAGKYDVYLYLGGIYEWKASIGEADKYDPTNASITAIYFEAKNPGTFTIFKMDLVDAQSEESGGSYEPGTHTTTPIYIPIEGGYNEGTATTTINTGVYPTTVPSRYGHLYYTISGGEATVTGYDGDDVHVTVPDTLGGAPVTAIGESAFAYNDRLQGVTLPSTLKSIGWSAFYDCVSLESIDIPDGVTDIASFAFENCWSLYEVELPSSLEWMGNSAFEGCPIGYVNIPDGVTNIPYRAFEGAKTVVIPGSVTSVDSTAFGYYPETMKHILFTGTKAQFKEIDQDLPLDWVTYHYGVSADSIKSVARHTHCVNTGYAEWHCSVCNTTYHDGMDEWEGNVYGGAIPPTGHIIGKDNRCESCGTRDTSCLTSPHPYETNILHRYKVVYPDAESVSVTFSNDTMIEDGYDWVYVYDASGALIDTYTGDELAGQTITVQGDVFELIMQADTTDCEYGINADAIEASGLVTLGDLNGDETIDMRDAFALYSATSGSSNLNDAQKAAADMNGDNDIDMRDAFALYKIASGG